MSSVDPTISEALYNFVIDSCDETISEQKYDQTKIVIIIDDTYKNNGIYTVRDGNLTYDVLSEREYKNGDIVRITLKDGYNSYKYIDGLADLGKVDTVKYASPGNHFIPMTQKEPLIQLKNLLSYKLNEKKSNMVEIAVWDFSSNPLSGIDNSEFYNTIYLKLKSQVSYGYYNFIKGDYSISVIIEFDEGRPNEFFSFKSSEFMGNPYSLELMNQEKLVSIPSLKGLKTIRFYFSMDDNFYYLENMSSQEPIFYTENLMCLEIPYLECQLGHLTDEQSGIKLFTFDSLIYQNPLEKNLETNSFDNSKKELAMIWYRNDSNKNFVGFSDIAANAEIIDEHEYIKADQHTRQLEEILNEQGDNPAIKDEVGLELLLYHQDNIDKFDQLTKWLGDLQIYMHAYQQCMLGLGETNGQAFCFNPKATRTVDQNRKFWANNSDTTNSLFPSVVDICDKITYEMLMAKIASRCNPDTHEVRLRFEPAPEGYNPRVIANAVGDIEIIKEEQEINGRKYLPGMIAYDFYTNQTFEQLEQNGTYNKVGQDAVYFIEYIKSYIKAYKLSLYAPNLGWINSGGIENQTYEDWWRESGGDSYYETLLSVYLKVFQNRILAYNKQVETFPDFTEFLIEFCDIETYQEGFGNQLKLLKENIDKIMKHEKDIFDIILSNDYIDIDFCSLSLADELSNMKEIILNLISIINTFKEVLIDISSTIDPSFVEKDYTFLHSAYGSSVNNVLLKIENLINEWLKNDNKAGMSYLSILENYYYKKKNNLIADIWKPNLNKEKGKNTLSIYLYYQDKKREEVDPILEEPGWNFIKNESQFFPDIITTVENQQQYAKINYNTFSIDWNQDAFLQTNINSCKMVIVYNHEIFISNTINFQNAVGNNNLSHIPVLDIEYDDPTTPYWHAGADLILNIQAKNQYNYGDKIKVYPEYDDIEDMSIQRYPYLTVNTTFNNSDLKYQFIYDDDNEYSIKSIKFFNNSPNNNELFKDGQYYLSCQCIIHYQDGNTYTTVFPIATAASGNCMFMGPKFIYFDEYSESRFDFMEPMQFSSSEYKEPYKFRLYYVFPGGVINNKSSSLDLLEYDSKTQQLSVKGYLSLLQKYHPVIEVLDKDSTLIYRQSLVTIDETQKNSNIVSNSIFVENLGAGKISQVYEDSGELSMSTIEYIPVDMLDVDDDIFVWTKNNPTFSKTYGLKEHLTAHKDWAKQFHSALQRKYINNIVLTPYSTLMRSRRQPELHTLDFDNENLVIQDNQIVNGVEISKNFPNFVLNTVSNLGKLSFNPNNDALLSTRKNGQGIEIYYDGTIKFFKNNLEIGYINIDNYNNLIFQESDLKIEVISTNEIISTCAEQ